MQKWIIKKIQEARKQKHEEEMKEKKKQYESKILGQMNCKQYSKDITKQSIL